MAAVVPTSHLHTKFLHNTHANTCMYFHTYMYTYIRIHLYIYISRSWRVHARQAAERRTRVRVSSEKKAEPNPGLRARVFRVRNLAMPFENPEGRIHHTASTNPSKGMVTPISDKQCLPSKRFQDPKRRENSAEPSVSPEVVQRGWDAAHDTKLSVERPTVQFQDMTQETYPRLAQQNHQLQQRSPEAGSGLEITKSARDIAEGHCKQSSGCLRSIRQNRAKVDHT